MLNVHKLNLASQQASIYIIGILELVFFGGLILVYKTDCSPELRTILKDVFLGWNTALALALNTGGLPKKESNLGSDTPIKADSEDPKTSTVVVEPPVTKASTVADPKDQN